MIKFKSIAKSNSAAQSTFRIRHLAALSLTTMLVISGCGNNTATKAASTSSPAATPSAAAEATPVPAADKLNIKVSFYPMYEFTKSITGDLANVEVLVPAGVEPHDWEPTAKDMADISDADVLVYNGAGMEGWAQQIVDGAAGSDLITIEASKGLQIIEGTEHEHDHEHSHEEEGAGEADHDHDHDHSHNDSSAGEADHDHDHGGLDPHVWLDPVMAIKEVRTIEAALSAAFPGNADAFHANSDAYITKLEKLDQDFRAGLQNTKRKDFITQHAAFGYLAQQYGLTQVPIAGLSPEQEPSAAQMVRIVEFAKANKVTTIFFETLVSSSVAVTIAQEIGAKTAVLNPIEGLTEEDAAHNLDYLSLMRQNLEALIQALNE